MRPDDDVSGRIYQAGQSGEFTVTVASGEWAWTAAAARDALDALRREVGKAVVGQDAAVTGWSARAVWSDGVRSCPWRR